MLIPAERPRAWRYPFAATVEIILLETGQKTEQKTKDISLYGCRVTSGDMLAPAIQCRLRIVHKGQIFEAFAKVTNVQRSRGAGLVFTGVEERAQDTLESWISDLRRNSRSRKKVGVGAET